MLKPETLSLALNLSAFFLCDQYNKRSKVSEVILHEKNIDRVVTAVVGSLQLTSLLRTQKKVYLSTWLVVM